MENVPYKDRLLIEILFHLSCSNRCNGYIYIIYYSHYSHPERYRDEIKLNDF